MPKRKENPGALAGASGVQDAVFGNSNQPIANSGDLQLRRLGDQSSTVAFVDRAGSQIGWIARGKGGWTGVRSTSAHSASFPTALAATRFVGGLS